MLFLDMIECSYQQDKNEQTMNGQTMNGQQDSKYQWTQFTSRLDAVEPARNDETAAGRFDDVEISTPRRGATSTRDFEKRRRAIVVKFQDQRQQLQPLDTIAASEPTTAPAHHEEVARPKTRSARRAADDEAEKESTARPPAPTPRPTLKRVRRNNYWVERDDQRRNAARTFKTNDRLIEEEYEEGMELED
jgi:hypothetical protein